MRLIDADALFDELVEKQYSAQSMGILHTGYPNMMAIVSKQPTVDAAEVVHGEWIEHKSASGGWHYDCPFCDDGFYMRERAKSKPNYCSNCGAKMDGGNRNDR